MNKKEILKQLENIKSLMECDIFYVDEEIVSFKLTNPPTESTSFTIKITQDSTGYSVGIDTCFDNGG